MNEDIENEGNGVVLDEPIIEFEVCEGGTLRLAEYEDATLRAEFYEGVADWWNESPASLANAMEECVPLAWKINLIYSEFREEIQAGIVNEPNCEHADSEKLDILKAQLAALPEESEEGAKEWLLNLDDNYFEAEIVSTIKQWFSESPDWIREEDYLSDWYTGQGQAMAYFQDMDQETLEILGVEVIEGDRPGSSYFAAEFHGDIIEANKTANASGLPVRFVECKDV